MSSTAFIYELATGEQINIQYDDDDNNSRATSEGYEDELLLHNDDVPMNEFPLLHKAPSDRTALQRLGQVRLKLIQSIKSGFGFDGVTLFGCSLIEQPEHFI